MQRVKKWLQRAYKKDLEIKVTENDYQTTKALVFSLSKTAGDIKIQSSTGKTIQEDAILKCMEYGELLNKRVAELYKIKTEIEKLIIEVEDTDRRILLQMRYLCYMSWDEIAHELEYSIRNIHYIHGKALQDINELCIAFHIEV